MFEGGAEDTYGYVLWQVLLCSLHYFELHRCKHAALHLQACNEGEKCELAHHPHIFHTDAASMHEFKMHVVYKPTENAGGTTHL